MRSYVLRVSRHGLKVMGPRSKDLIKIIGGVLYGSLFVYRSTVRRFFEFINLIDSVWVR